MTEQTQNIKPDQFLHELIDTDQIEDKATKVGFIQRLRKLVPLTFVVHIIFAMPIGQFAIDALRRSYLDLTDVKLNRTSWRERFNKPLLHILAWLLGSLRTRAHRRRDTLHFKGPLKRFRDVMLVDSTFIQVHDSLARWFKGTRKAAAAIKIHTRIRALTGELLWHRITAGSAADCKSFGVSWKDRACLFLFDKGYQSSSLWWRIHRVGGFFITRLPGSYKPIIESVNTRHRGRARALVGKSLRDELKRLKRSVLDVQCRFRIHIRGYRGKRGRYEWVTFRVVGLWNVEEKKYHLYVTNLPSKNFDAELVGQGYALRWEVETFYRLGKSGLGLDQVKRLRMKVRVKIVVLCALIRASVAMQARCHARISRSGDSEDVRLNPELWTLVWREQMDKWAVQALVCGHQPNCSWDKLVYMAHDANPQRTPLREQFLQSFCGDGFTLANVLAV